MGRIFDQFVLFGTDIVGLERFFRLIQSICHILSASPSLLLLIAPLLQVRSSPSSIWNEGDDRSSRESTVVAAATLAAMAVQLRNRVNVVRRAMRLFRFLDSFRSARCLLSPPSAATKSPTNPSAAETNLDVISLTLLGIYGLLESATLPDAMDVPGLGAWGEVRAAVLNAEAQRCWFAALGFGVLAGGARLPNIAAHSPVPSTGAERGGVGGGDGREKETRKREQEEQRELARRESGRKRRAIVWRMASDALDMLLPASAMGWVETDQWLVGSAMLVTTVITGLEVWDRCGRELARVT